MLKLDPSLAHSREIPFSFDVWKAHRHQVLPRKVGLYWRWGYPYQSKRKLLVTLIQENEKFAKTAKAEVKFLFSLLNMCVKQKWTSSMFTVSFVVEYRKLLFPKKLYPCFNSSKTWLYGCFIWTKFHKIDRLTHFPNGSIGKMGR